MVHYILVAQPLYTHYIPIAQTLYIHQIFSTHTFVSTVYSLLLLLLLLLLMMMLHSVHHRGFIERP